MSDDLDFTRFERFDLLEFQCNAGWRPLLHDLLRKIDALLGPERTIEVRQIKEKFGELRIYWRGEISVAEQQHIQSLVDDAIRVSRRTCELCSKPAKVHPWNGGFWQANCVEHAREAVLERKRTPNGPGWLLATSRWQIVNPATGVPLSKKRLDELYGEARATLEANGKSILGDLEGWADIFGQRVRRQQAAKMADEFLIAWFVQAP